MTKTNTQKIYEKAKKNGKVSERKEWLKLGVKKKGGGVKSTGPHEVEFISDKVVMGRDYTTKKERKEVKYTFQEDGEEKFYSVPLFNKKGKVHYLVEGLRAYDYGDEFILELKWVGDRNVVDLRDIESETEDVPVVEEDTEEELEDEEDVDVDDIPF